MAVHEWLPLDLYKILNPGFMALLVTRMVSEVAESTKNPRIFGLSGQLWKEKFGFATMAKKLSLLTIEGVLKGLEIGVISVG